MTIVIIGDYEKIEISLFNLISNAFKYTAEWRRNYFKVNSKRINRSYFEISDTGEELSKRSLK